MASRIPGTSRNSATKLTRSALPTSSGRKRPSRTCGIRAGITSNKAAEGQGDVVIGFEHLVDRLDFAVGGFGGLALGVLAGANFALNTTGLPPRPRARRNSSMRPIPGACGGMRMARAARRRRR